MELRYFFQPSFPVQHKAAQEPGLHMVLSLGLKHGVVVVPPVDAVALSSLLLKAIGSLISIPSAF